MREEISENSGSSSQILWIPLSKRSKLSFWHIVCICGSMMSYQFAYSVLSALSTPLMNNVLKFQSWVAQIVWTIGPVVGLLYQPFIGYLSDRVHYKMGRRRPFIIIGAIGTVAGFGFLFCVVYIKSIPLTWKRIIFVFALAVSHIFINTMQGPARTILGDIIPKDQQIYANSIGSLLISVSAVLINCLGGFRISLLIDEFSDIELTIIFGMFFMLIGMIVTVLSAKEEQFTEELDKKNPLKSLLKSIRDTPKPVFIAATALLLSWVAYWPWYVNCTAFFSNDIFAANEPDPTKVEKAKEEGLAFGMLVIALENLVSVFYSIIQDKIVKLIGLKWNWSIAQMISAAALAPTYWIKNKYVLMGLMSLLGISYTAFQTIPFSIVGIMITDDLMGTCMCALSIFVGIGQQVGALLICTAIGQPFGDEYKQILSISAAFAVLAGIVAFLIPSDQKTKIVDEYNINQDPLLDMTP